MKSIATGSPVGMDEDLHGQKHIKRKQGSALRSLRDSFKFRGSTSHSKNCSPHNGSSNQGITSKVRRSSVGSVESRKANQRLSAQRISLFKYEKVRAISAPVSGNGRVRSSTDTSSDTTRSSDTVSVSSNKSRSSVKLKPTMLMASGTLEVYQIYTPSQNATEKRQEMNYLSLGRKDNIVHPILPRLQITKVHCSGHRFIISFFNPERFWEIEFLPMSDPEALLSAVRKFESVIGNICDFSRASDEAKLPIPKNVKIEQQSIGKQTNPKSGHEKYEQGKCDRAHYPNNENGHGVDHDVDRERADDNDDDNDNDDDLSYLLEEDEEEETDEETGRRQPKGCRSSDNESELTIYYQAALSKDKDGPDGAVNVAFRKAMQNVKPSCTSRNTTSEGLSDYNSISKRYSSYQPHDSSYIERCKTVSRRLSYVQTKRSYSVPMLFRDENTICVTKRADRNSK